jgi:hypothetical protein
MPTLGWWTITLAKVRPKNNGHISSRLLEHEMISDEYDDERRSLALDGASRLT